MLPLWPDAAFARRAVHVATPTPHPAAASARSAELPEFRTGSRYYYYNAPGCVWWYHSYIDGELARDGQTLYWDNKDAWDYGVGLLFYDQVPSGEHSYNLIGWHDVFFEYQETYYWISDYGEIYDMSWKSLYASGPSPPSIASINPNNAPRGSSGTMTFTGQHLWDENPSIYVDGTGVTITPGSSWPEESYHASYSIASDADSGVHHVAVTTSGGTSNAVEFTVTDPSPQIYSISPNTWDAGSTEYVTIWGTDFGSNPSVAAGPYVNVTVNSASDTQINGTAWVSSTAPGGSQTVTVTSHGMGGMGFMPVPGGGTQSTATGTVTILAAPTASVMLSPSVLNLSTGDTNKQLTTSVSPSTISFTAVYSYNRPASQPSGGQCDVNLSIPNGSGTGSVNSTVTASPAGCSNVLNVYANAAGTTSNYVTVVVPPQILIQMLYGEASGQVASGDMSQLSLGAVARNRFGDVDFGNYTTYYDVITNTGFAHPSISYGHEPELPNAAKVYTNDPSTVGIVEDAKCFWSPKTVQWNVVQTALQSQTTVFSDGTGVPGCWLGQPRQILYKTSIGLSTRGGEYQGAPAFLFLRKRTASEPGVRQIN